jgi:predicted metal-binding membrane protein
LAAKTGSDPEPPLTRLLGRERLPIAVALAGITALAWAYLFLLTHHMAAMPSAGPTAGDVMTGMSGMAMTTAGFRPWTPAYFSVTLAMWWVMMIGMMTPSAAPMILMYDRISRGNRAHGVHAVPTGLFAGAYLAVWGLFSVVATFAQLGLESAAVMAPMQPITSPVFGGALFIAAGLFQLTPLKNACLRRCRSPLSFIMGHWRDGTAGALRLGALHGLYCLGCCWILMTLLFVGGVMNLLWIAIVAIYVLAEKLFPAGALIARLGGAAMIAFGIYLIAAAPPWTG